MMTSKEGDFLLNAGFTKEQAEEIIQGKKAGLNISYYANRNFLPIQMRQIRLGLLENLPVEKYASKEFDWFQMEEIRKGLKSGVDISLYASSEIPYEKMRQLRKGLEEGVNLTPFIQMEANVIREIRRARRSGVNIIKYISEGYDSQQLFEIRLALEQNLDLDPYLSKEYRAASIVEIREGLKNGVDVSLYAMIDFSWQQMREIRLGLENRVEVEKYISHLYSWDQMREIRLGLEMGLDVDSYRLLRYTAGEMNKKRLAILEGISLEQEKLLQNQITADDFLFDFSDNNMDVSVTLLKKDKIITKKKFLDILEQNGIVKGIREDVVEKIVRGDGYKKSLMIAKGELPRQGEDGWYEYFFRTNIDKKPKVLEDGSVDFRNMDWFEMVKEGQKLAVYHEAKEGTDGYDITGAVIKARKGIEQRILTGQGFQIDEDKKTYSAAIDGMITLEGNEMKITRHMLLDEVTIATGNIQFDGSIHILGDVGYGAVVKATEDIVVDGNVEGATIESGGSIVLKKGMNAAGLGMITAGKDVVSRFFEAVKVVARGNIEVGRCLNSQLYAEGIITSSNTITGGVAQASKGFKLKHVGNHAGLRTVLKVKADDKIQEENRIVKVAIEDVKNELQMLLKSYEEFTEKFPPEVRSTMDVFAKIEKAVFTKKKQLEQLKYMEDEIEEMLKKVKEARIVIDGQAHEGTILEIDGTRWLAENQRNIIIKKQNQGVEVISQ